MRFSRIGRTFVGFIVTFAVVFSFCSPSLALIITEPTDYPSSMNGYSLPETITVNTGETADIIVTEPGDGTYCSISWSYSGSNIYRAGSGSSYWGKQSHFAIIGKHAGTMRLVATISVYDGPYQQGVTRNRVYDDFNLECYITVVGEDYIDPAREPIDPLNPPIVVNDTDVDQKTLVGFVEWMQQRPGLTTEQVYDLNKAAGVLLNAQNEPFSIWGATNTGLPESRGGYVTAVSDPDDAISIINLQRAIMIMRDINSIRATDPLFSGSVVANPGRTNFYLMAVAATGADRGAVLRRHSLLQVSCENLAFGGYRTAAWMWNNERSGFVSVMNNMGMNGLSSFQDVKSVYNEAASRGITVGHYTNLFWAQDQVMGVGYTTYGGTACFNASALSNYDRYATYTVDEFEALLNEYLGLHNWNEGVVTTASSCTTDGLMTHTCIDCGATRLSTIPAGHTASEPVRENVTNATCTTDGVCDEVYYCVNCHEEISRTVGVVIPATGHSLIHYPETPASCDHTGYIDHWECSGCGCYYSDADGINEISADSVIIPETAHTPVTDAAVAATCTTEGLTEGSHCDVCGTVITAQTTIPALRHSVEYVAPVSATETTSGNIAYYRCLRCNLMWSDIYQQNPVTIEQVIIPAIGHNLEHVTVSAPSCTGDGNIEYWRCSTCNRYFSDPDGINEISSDSVVIPALGHTPVTDPAVAPTETATGLTEGSHCSVCGTVLVPQSVVPALGGTTPPNPIVTPDQEPTAPGAVNMYRLYNPNSGEHFYTSNSAERDMLIGVGWNYEGIGWTAPSYSNTPVYRLYNQNGGEHHYTTNVAERDMLVSLGWNDEGIGWYSDDNQTVPLYRQYNPNAFANNHNYTTSLSENDWLVSIGWQAEGVGWYGVG